MSLAAMLWALNEAPVTDPTAKLILIAMADHANDRGQGVYASQARIASRALCTDRTVRTHLVELERAGLIRRGDQELISHYRPDRRPVVWDLCLAERPEDISGRKRSVGTTGSAAPNDRKLISDKPKHNQELNREDRPLTGDALLASLRSAQRTPSRRCSHGEPMHRHPDCFDLAS